MEEEEEGEENEGRRMSEQSHTSKLRRTLARRNPA
jgi:hypothetical protein